MPYSSKEIKSNHLSLVKTGAPPLFQVAIMFGLINTLWAAESEITSLLKFFDACALCVSCQKRHQQT